MIEVLLCVKDNDGDDETRKVKMPFVPRIGETVECFRFFKDVFIDGFEEDTLMVVTDVDWVYSSGKWSAQISLEKEQEHSILAVDVFKQVFGVDLPTVDRICQDADQLHQLMQKESQRPSVVFPNSGQIPDDNSPQ